MHLDDSRKRFDSHGVSDDGINDRSIERHIASKAANGHGIDERVPAWLHAVKPTLNIPSIPHPA